MVVFTLEDTKCNRLPQTDLGIWKITSLGASHTCLEEEWDEETLRWIQLWRCSINFPWYEVRQLDWGPWASSGGSLEYPSTCTDTHITRERNNEKKIFLSQLIFFKIIVNVVYHSSIWPFWQVPMSSLVFFGHLTLETGLSYM